MSSFLAGHALKACSDDLEHEGSTNERAPLQPLSKLLIVRRPRSVDVSSRNTHVWAQAILMRPLAYEMALQLSFHLQKAALRETTCSYGSYCHLNRRGGRGGALVRLCLT